MGREALRRALLLLPAIALAAASCSPARDLPDDGFVDVPGGRVAFRVLGDGAGAPLLLIHGGPGGTSCSFATTLHGVAALRPVVIYDQLGSGNSDRMQDLERDAVLPRFVAEVRAIREELELEEIHLAGISWGATVALEYLLTEGSEGILSLTLGGPLISTPLWLDDARVLVDSLPEETRRAIEQAEATGDWDSPDFQAANRVFAAAFGSRAPRGQVRFPACESTPVRFNADLYRTMWGPSEFVATGTLRDFDRSDRLEEIDVPTLFLVGEYDEARPETVRAFQERVPGARLEIIAGAAHATHVDETEAFNEILSSHLASAETGE